jgi:hypothetical protein
VTFVALGNGAPDLSANIAAISAGEVVLSAGALTGAAMFVQVKPFAAMLGGISASEKGRKQFKSGLLHFMLFISAPSISFSSQNVMPAQCNPATPITNQKKHLRSSPAPGPVALSSVGGPQER